MNEGFRYAQFVLVFALALATGCSTHGAGSSPAEGQSKNQEGENSVAFSPSYTLCPGETAYARAQDIYDSSTKPPPQGVYRLHGLVFVVVCIDTNNEKLRFLEGTAMLRAKALLKSSFPLLPSQFTLQNRLLEKNLDEDTGLYRYVLVVRESDVQEGMKSNSLTTRNP